MKIKSILAALEVSLAGVSAAAPVYETKNMDVSPTALKCRRVGVETLDGDAFSRKDFWKIQNYSKRLGIEVGGVRDEVKGLCLDGSAKTCDTAWRALSGSVPLKRKGPRYRLGFRIDTTVAIKLPNAGTAPL